MAAPSPQEEEVLIPPTHTPPPPTRKTQPPEKMLPLLLSGEGLQDKSQAKGVEGHRGITQSPSGAWEGAGNGRKRGEGGRRKSPCCEGETPAQLSGAEAGVQAERGEGCGLLPQTRILLMGSVGRAASLGPAVLPHTPLI